MINRLWLVKNGVPFDLAMELGDAESLAFGVIFGGFEGRAFDWKNMHWIER